MTVPATQASLPMYDLPELRAETDALWAGFVRAFRAEGLANVPDRLIRSDDLMALWTAPGLFFSQTCGFPLTHALKERVCLVATPVYDCPGCEGGRYHSEILVRGDDPVSSLPELRGRRAAVNSWDSQSGYNALRFALGGSGQAGAFFSAVLETGSHRASMIQLRRGAADVCAVDTVTWHLLCRVAPDLTDGLRVLSQSEAAPALPYITRPDIASDDLRRLQAGLQRAMDAADLRDVRAGLLLHGVVVQPLSAYDRIVEMESAASAMV